MGPSNGVTVDITAQIVGYQDSIKQLQRELAKVNPGSEIGKKLRKEIDSATKELQGLEKNTKVKVVNDSQVDAIVGKVNHLGESIQQVSYLMQQVTSQDLNFSAFSEGIDSFRKSISSLQEELSGKLSSGIQETIANSAELKNVFENILSVKVDEASPAQLFDALAEGAERAAEQVKSASNTIDSVERKIQNKQRELNKRETGQFKDADARDQLIKEVNDLKQSYDDIFDPIREKMTESLKNKLGENSSVNWKEILDSFFSGLNPDNIKDKINSLFDSLKNAGVYNKKAEFYSELFGGGRNINEVVSNIDLGDPEPIIAKLKELTERIASEIGGKNKAAVLELLDKNQVDEAADKTIDVIGKAYNKVQTEIQSRKDQITDLLAEKTAAEGQRTAAESANTAIKTAEEDLRNRMSEILNENKDLQQRINTLEQQMQQMLDNKAGEINRTAGNVNIDTKGWIIGRDAVENYKKSVSDVHAKEQLIGRLRGVAERWFSIYAAVRLVEKAIYSVINTIKELDATITEIAIVTNMTQEDLWNQMQSYTDLAQQYAASISGVYKVSQLYYQQGLQTKEVMELTEQTLKMARISGLDYAEATDYMTNAVRSFKMEMDDAQRVVDVYSAIAAKSATNVAELANAMSKTASSAQAVGASFENTTAMMAVMIETTRESSQNIGSALKSIISRYGELKENPATLVDSEGEELSLNKVDKALKSVGITLQDTNGQFRAFDDVIMELSEKWDTIDTNTQRYIATIMAGNRQQSRFLALVSSYDRLKELSEEAANSEDAAQLQYLKTLDGVEAKLQQIKNSLQTLYVDSGLEKFFKNALDFGNNLIKTFTNLPKLANLPIVAISKFSLLFISVANVVKTTIKALSQLLINGFRSSSSQMTSSLSESSQNRTQITQNEIDYNIEQYRRGADAFIEQQERMTQAQASGGNVRKGNQINNRDNNGNLTNKNAADTKVFGRGTAARAVGSVALSLFGSITSLKAASMGEQTEQDRTTKGILTMLGGAGQGAGLGMRIGGFKGAIIGAIIGTVYTGLAEAFDIFQVNAQEAIANLKTEVENTNNERIKSKNDFQTLTNYQKKWEALSKVQYQSAENQQEFINLQNEIAANYPELISYMDKEGNYVVDLTNAYQRLAESKYNAYSEDNKKALEAELKGISNIDYVVEQLYGKKIYQDTNKFQQIFGETETYSALKALREKGSLLDGEFLWNNDTLNEIFSSALSENQPDLMQSKVDEKFSASETNIYTSTFMTNFMNMLWQAVYERGAKSLEELQADFNTNFISQVEGTSGEKIDVANYKENYLELLEYVDANLINVIKTYKSATENQNGLAQSAVRKYLQEFNTSYSLFTGEKRSQLALDVLSYRGGTQFNEVLQQAMSKGIFGSKDAQTLTINGKAIEILDKENGISYETIWKAFEQEYGQKFIEWFSSPDFDKPLTEAWDNIAYVSKNKLQELTNGLENQDEILATYTDLYGTNLERFSNYIGQIFEGSTEFANLANELGFAYLQDLTNHLEASSENKPAQEKIAKLYEEFQDNTEILTALSGADLTSITGIYTLLNNLIEKGIDTNQISEALTGSDGLVNYIKINIVTEIESFIQSIKDNIENFDKALSNASKGMDVNEAIKMADRLKTSITDFRFEGGKYFYDAPEDIEKAYLNYSSDLLEKLAEEYKAEAVALGIKYNNANDTEKAAIAEEFNSLNNSYDSLVAATTQYVQYQKNAALIQNGFIRQAIENVLGKDNTEVDRVQKDILNNDYSNIPQELTQYVSEFQKLTQNLTKNIFDKALTSLKEGSQQIITANTDQEKDLIRSIGGYQILGTTNQFIVEVTKSQIDNLMQSINSNEFLTDAQKSSLLKDLHTVKFENNLTTVFSNIANNYESFSYDVAQNLADAFGASIKYLQESGLIKETLEGTFKIEPEELQKYLQGALAAGNIDIKTYNELMSKVDKTTREKSISNVMQSVIKNRASLTEDNIQQIATALGLAYDDIKAFLTSNGDGSYSASIQQIQTLIQTGNVEVTTALTDLLYQEVGSIIDEVLGISQDLAKGYTKVSDINKFKQNFEKAGFKNEYNFKDFFEWDKNLNSYRLTNTGIKKTVALAQQQQALFTEGTAEWEMYGQFIESMGKQFAQAIDIKSFIDSDNTQEAIDTLTNNINDYNALLVQLGKRQIFKPEEVIAALQQGGKAAVDVAMKIAERQGRTLSQSEINALYRKPVSRYLEAVEELGKGVGTVLSDTAQAVINEKGQIAASGIYVITSTVDLANAYRNLYDSIESTNAYTINELNKVSALAFEAESDSKIVEALSSATGMTYQAFGELLANEGIKMSEALVNKMKDSNIISDIGGGKLRINNFTNFAELMGWSSDSEEYTSAFKAYNDSLIELNRSAQKEIIEVFNKISSSKPGDWINVAALSKTTQESISKLGYTVSDGLLQIGNEANIPELLNTILEDSDFRQGLLASELAELQDTIIQIIQSIANLIAKGIQGALSQSEAVNLNAYSKNLGIEKLNFYQTADGLKIAQDSAIELYYAINNIDKAAGNIVFKELRDNLEKSGEDCENISKTMNSIANLEKEIANSSEDNNGTLSKRLELYKQISKLQMQDPEQYNFMNRKLPSQFQGPVNYYDSVVKMVDTIKESAKTGYMGVDDFYNIVTEMNNMASVGNEIEIYGVKLDGSLEKGAELIQKGFDAMTAVEGSGAQIDLKQMGVDFKTGVAGMSTELDKGLTEMAKEQIEWLDGMIAFLQTVIAMEGLEDLTDESGSIKAFDENGNFTTAFSSWKEGIINQTESNEELQKVLQDFKVNNVSLLDLLKADENQLKDLGFSFDEYLSVLEMLRGVLSSGNYDLSNFASTYQQFNEEFSGVLEVQGKEIVVARGTVITPDKNGFYVVDGQKYNDVKTAIIAARDRWNDFDFGKLSEFSTVGSSEGKKILRYTLENNLSLDVVFNEEEGTYSIKGLNGDYKTPLAAIRNKIKQDWNDDKTLQNKYSNVEDFAMQAYGINLAPKIYLKAPESMNDVDTSKLQQWLADPSKYMGDIKKLAVEAGFTFVDDEGNSVENVEKLTSSMLSQLSAAFGIETKNEAINIKAHLELDEVSKTWETLLKTDTEISKTIKLHFNTEEYDKLPTEVKNILEAYSPSKETGGSKTQESTDKGESENLKEQVKNQQQELENKVKEIADLQSSLEDKSKIISQKEEEISNLQANVASLEDQISNLTTQNEQLSMINSYKEDVIDSLQSVLDGLKDEIASEKEKSRKLKEDYEALIEQNNKDWQEAAADSLAQENEIIALTAEKTALESKNAELTTRIAELETELNEASASLWEEVGEQIYALIEQLPGNDKNKFFNKLRENEDLYNGWVQGKPEALLSALGLLTDVISSLPEKVTGKEGASQNTTVSLEPEEIPPTEAPVDVVVNDAELKETQNDLTNLKGGTTIPVNVQISYGGGTGGIDPVKLAEIGNAPFFRGKAKGNVALAKGTKTLMGELGPELYVSNGRYYVAGQGGAEFVNLPDDAIVFNHLQTKRLLDGGSSSRGKAIKGENKAVAFAKGTTGPAKASASAMLANLQQIRAQWNALLNLTTKDLANKAGGGGGGDDDKQLKNVTAEIQRWYNLLRQIDKLEKDISYQEQLRAKIESDRVVNGRAMYSTYKEELKYLDQEIARNKELANLQKSWYDRKREELANSDYGKIFTYDENGLQQYVGDSRPGSKLGLDILETLTKRDVNGQAIGAAENVKTQLDYLKSVGFNIESLKYNNDGTVIDTKKLKGDKLDEAYVQMMQNFWDNLDGWRDELDSIYDSYHEQLENVISNEEKRNGLLQEIIDNQLSVEQSIYKAIEEREQAAIDRAQKERDALSDAAEKFLDGLSEQLDREQKMREKNDTDTETNKLRRQLAILQRSGGSASQIRSLENEIRNRDQDAYFQAQQDQIDAIKEASDAQLERLDHQIDIMTETLEYQKEHGLLWEEVYQIMAQTPEQIQQFIMENTPDFESNSALQVAEDLRKLKGEIELWISSRDDSDNPIYTDAGHNWSSYVEASQNRYKDILTDELLAQAKAAFDAEYVRSADPNAAGAAADAILNKKLEEYNRMHGIGIGSSSGSGTSSSGSGNGNGKYWNIRYADGKQAGKRYSTKKEAEAALAQMQKNAEKAYHQTLHDDFIDDPNLKKKWQDLLKATVFSYSRGGLADYTGLAMVHGSKSRPEAFLNAEQTEMWKNDILGKRNSLTSLLLDFTSALGDLADSNTYNTINRGEAINIDKAEVIMNVGSIANDYDARRAGESALEQMLSIARKTGARGVSRG